MKKLPVILALILLLHFEAAAQFSTSASDPGNIRWNSVSSVNFEVIYPRGCDSLGIRYLKSLEKWRIPVSASSGILQNDGLRKPLPVILHTLNASSNGVVTWTPRRMELYTIPEWNNPSAMPWHTMLSIHEGRHAAQMQNGYRRVFRPFGWFFGEIIPGIASAWPGKLLLEGDAVVAETALSRSGRGRSASFLNYYMYCLDNGLTRPWARWRYSSIYNVTPDHYATGYMLLSGIRAGWDKPLLMSDYFDYVSRRPYDPWPLRHLVRRSTGKGFDSVLPSIFNVNYSAWAKDTLSRGPFVKTERISRTPRKHTPTFYDNPNEDPRGGCLWIKEDPFHLPALVSLDSLGNERKLRLMNPSIGKINYEEADSSLLWNELRKDPRWGQKRESVVKHYHIPSGRLSTVSNYGDNLYPIALEGDLVAVVQYLQKGGSVINLISRDTGRKYYSLNVPDSLQIVEITHVGTDLFAAAISDCGFGIYKVSGWKELLPPIPVQIGGLESDGDNALTFECDHNGSWEFYRYELSSGNLYRLTSSKYGASSYNYCLDGSMLFSGPTGYGSAVYKIKKEDLQSTPVQWQDYHHYPIADKLSRQEDSLLALRPQAPLDDTFNPKPKKYSKGRHGINFHSWAPCYINIDAIKDLSFDSFKHIVSLGAMGFFQNSFSTLYGHIGYKAAPIGGKWYHSGHLNLTYSGLYPVFEGQFHIGEGNASDYVLNTEDSSIDATPSSRPAINASLSSYIPLSWDNGVTIKGLVPKAGLVFSNNRFEGKYSLLMNVSVRGYVVQHTPEGCVFPRWGVGAEAAWADPVAYWYLYGYVPGGCRGQGIKLSALHQKEVNGEAVFLSTLANIIPRGFNELPASALLNGTKLSVEYAYPFYMGDWHISDAVMCNRGIFTPHCDLTFVGSSGSKMLSAGGTFELQFPVFLWIKVPVTIGVTAFWNDWSNNLKIPGAGHFSIGATFNIEI